MGIGFTDISIAKISNKAKPYKLSVKKNYKESLSDFRKSQKFNLVCFKTKV